MSMMFFAKKYGIIRYWKKNIQFFVSQANTPIKGLHFLLEALPLILNNILLQNYILLVALIGDNILGTSKLLYDKYIRDLINTTILTDAFHSNLNELEMF